MSYKPFKIDDLGIVTVYKNRNSKSLKLSIATDNSIKVSIPIWAPYRAGLNYAKSQSDWIKQNLGRDKQPTFFDKQEIGKYHKIKVNVGDHFKTPNIYIERNTIYVCLNDEDKINETDIQEKLRTKIILVLKEETKNLIFKRVDELSKDVKLDYNSLKLKVLKRRWGSCDSRRNLTFNIFLIQLPWEVIDYVIVHELVHTVYLAHDHDFWNKMNELVPNLKHCRNEIKKYKPIIY